MRPPQLYEPDGVSHSLSEWAAVTGIDSRTIYARVHVYGHSFSDAISLPVGAPWRNRRATKFMHDGRNLSILEWSKSVGVPVATLRARLTKGWTIGQAISIPTPSQRGRGVVSNLPASVGTGGGSTAQEIKKIIFFKDGTFHVFN